MTDHRLQRIAVLANVGPLQVAIYLAKSRLDAVTRDRIRAAIRFIRLDDARRGRPGHGS